MNPRTSVTLMSGRTWWQRARTSVRVRITVLGSVFVLLVTAFGSVLIVAAITHSLSNSLIDSARLDAVAINAQLRRGVSPAEAATTGRNDVVVQLVGPDGTVVASDRPERLKVALRTTPGVTESAVVPGLADSFTLVARRATGDTGVALIIVGRSTEQRNETRAETAGVLATAVPLIVLALGLILWISVGRALRPVEVMRDEADRITVAQLRRRLQIPPGEDEIPRLARTLNEMLDRIDEGQRLQRQFVSDASHELRSPLAVIRQAAEIASAYPARVTSEELAADVLAESLRLEELVNALLLLARLEGGDDSAREVVDVDDLVLTEVARARARPGVKIDAHAVGAGQVRGSAVLLGQVVRNLLDNACRHADSVVSVSLAEEDGTVCLVVDDDGPGIPAADRARVFDRFVRLDDARARDEGGSGLGLAIVRKIVDSGGGSVQVTDSPAGGARFTVRLPAVAV
ncbi:sensor histidine kinase [Nocardioides pocheonensis]|uniref:histidine kinase n=2 Tax=Nocardioides pocheonensis TaxID=661485 RepID=A0A3N0GUX7_9ACTN|nr:sensor histidine kinase [Nocardioides pocheonensis]